MKRKEIEKKYGSESKEEVKIKRIKKRGILKKLKRLLICLLSLYLIASFFLFLIGFVIGLSLGALYSQKFDTFDEWFCYVREDFFNAQEYNLNRIGRALLFFWFNIVLGPAMLGFIIGGSLAFFVF